ncbi:GAF domain-containing sensor histidine kinase [Fulvivirga sp. RKSG066]|uniref:GAF domain-containing sensor histidine kinase n=1 Tax=Fulvivirga aurantia TaxID=2529383 RepID=UPI0012BD1580|nr:GAF domain-containing sensor histidine kinase [Fulvivirga aurantia]MTI22742.1 GAF domain-containing sensor histidine kinase [Fulvivirga aurantia]
MIKPEIASNDHERVAALLEYNIIDTLPEKAYDDVARLAQNICSAKVALVSFIDTNTQYFKAHPGTDLDRNTRELALCAHTINQPGKITYAPDTRIDERFRENPMVTGPTQVQFYAGVPLLTKEGHALGTICVMDHTPKYLNKTQLESLELLGHQVMKLLELRKKNSILSKNESELEAKNKELGNFAAAVSHDIKSPLNNMGAIAKILLKDKSEQLDSEGVELLEYLSKSALKLNGIVQGMLTYYKNSQFDRETSTVNLKQSFDEVVSVIGEKDLIVETPSNLPLIKVNKTALELIFSNLITNAIKYSDKAETKIILDFNDENEFYTFSITDNGIGIDKADQAKIFKHYTNLGKKDRHDNLGTGLGLALVKKILDDLKGTIKVTSEVGKGSTFIFTLPK